MKQLCILIALVIAMSAHGQRQVSKIGTNAKVYDNPDYVKHAYKKIVVKADIPTSRILQEYASLNVEIVDWDNVFSPVNDYKPEDIQNILEKNGADGLIRIEEQDYTDITIQAQTDVLVLTLYDAKGKLNALRCMGNAFRGVMSTLDRDRAVKRFMRLTLPEVKRAMTP